jgi:hypothetical protein
MMYGRSRFVQPDAAISHTSARRPARVVLRSLAVAALIASSVSVPLAERALAAPGGFASGSGSTIGSALIDRPATFSEGGGTPSTALSASATATHFAALTVTVPSYDIFEVEAASSSEYGFAPVLCLYAGQFSPASPLTNNMGCSNSSNSGATLSAKLIPGTVYVAVVSGKTNADQGDFGISVVGNTSATIYNRSTLTGATAAVSKTTARPVEGSAPLQAGSSTDQYEVSGFGVTAAGTYTFDVGGSFNAFACLYSSTFDEASASTGGLVCADVGGSTPQGARFNASLLPGNRYVLMVTGSEAGQYGSWSASIDGPSAVVKPQLSGDLMGKPLWTHPTTATPPGTGVFKSPFEARPFQVSQTGTYSAYLGEDDQFVCVYTAPFDPSDPMHNALKCDDDSGDSKRSSLVMPDLVAGTQYVLVASSFNNASGVGPWVGEFYGPGFAITVPNPPTLTGLTPDGSGNLAASFRGAELGQRPNSYTAHLSPYLGGPGPSVSGPSPLTIPLPAGSVPGDQLSLVFTGNSAAGSSISTELTPPQAEPITGAAATSAFGATLTYSPVTESVPNDTLTVSTSTSSSALQGSVEVDPQAGAASLPALSPGTAYTFTVTHSDALGSAVSTTTLTTPSATSLGTSAVSASGPTFTRPNPGKVFPLPSSSNAVHFQSTYLHVATPGTYSFLATGTGWDSFLTLVRGGFDPASPLATAIAADDDAPGVKIDAYSTQVLTQTLAVGDYALVLSGGTSSDVGTAAMFVSGSPLTSQAPGAPGAPGISSLVDAGVGKATIGLTPPLDPQGSITGYVARFHPVTGSDIVKSLTVQASQAITGLTDGADYQVTLQAINAAGTGEPTAPLSYREAAVPDAPAAPTVDMITATTAQVTFTPGSANGAAITGYSAVVQPGGLVFPGAVTGDPIVLSGLTRGASYNVSLTAVNSHGVSPSSAPTAFKTATKPASPVVSAVVPGVHSATFSITAPDDRGSPITSYGVTLTPTSGSSPAVTLSPAPTAAGSVTVNGLVSLVTYTISVTATNIYGTGDSSAPATVTPTSQTAAAPVSTGVDGQTPTSAVLHFTAPANSGTDPVTSYIATVQPGGMSYPADAAATSVVLSSLAPNTNYSVSVVALTGAGTSPASSGQSFTTFGPPAAPAITSLRPYISAFSVSYTAPAENGSQITGYRLTATPVGSSTPASSITVTALGGSIRGLHALTDYAVSVEAINEFGTGPAVSMDSKTLAPIPGRPTVTAAVPGHAQLKLLLKAPPTKGNVIHVVITPRSGGASRTIDAHFATVIIDGLRDGSRYVIDVSERSSGGSSGTARIFAIPGKPAFTFKVGKLSHGRSAVTARLTVSGTGLAGQIVSIVDSRGRTLAAQRTNAYGNIAVSIAVRAGTSVRALTVFGPLRVGSHYVRVI